MEGQDKKRPGGAQLKEIQNFLNKQINDIRRRPRIYLGDPYLQRTLHRMVFELVDYVIDEHISGGCDEVQVTFNLDRSVTVSDNGYGAPIANESDCEYYFRALKTHVFRCGYCCVNALSEIFCVTICKEGAAYEISYERGMSTSPLKNVKQLPSNGVSGTKIMFRPDPKIFGENIFFDYKKIRRRLDELAAQFPKLKIYLDDKQRPQQKCEIYSPNGLEGYHNSMIVSANVTLAQKRVVFFEGQQQILYEDEGVMREAACGASIYMAFTDENCFVVDGFVNTLPICKGTHINGLRKGLERTLNNLPHDHRRLLCQKGIIAVISIPNHPRPILAHENTKAFPSKLEKMKRDTLFNPEVEGLISDIVAKNWKQLLGYIV